MADYTLSAKITADIKGFVSNINTVTKKAESMAEKLSSSMQPVKTAAASAKEDILPGHPEGHRQHHLRCSRFPGSTYCCI